MDKHEPCEHEVKDTPDVTVAEVHVEDQQSSLAESQLNQTLFDGKDQDDKKAKKLSDEESNLKTVSDHPLKPTDQLAKESGGQNQSPTPRIMLHRSNFDNVKPTTLPKVNCKEKIILCIDNSSSMFSSCFKRTLPTIKQSSVFDVLLGALKQFIMTKSFLNKKHEFSLVVLNEEAQLITRFIDKGSEVLYRLQEIANSSQSDSEETSTEEQKGFDMTGLYDLIADLAEIPPKQSQQTSPTCVVRVIIVYGRSQGNLEFKAGKESYEKLTHNPFFFTDCLYIHEDPAESNNVTNIFSRLCELDKNGSSYILEVSVEGSMSALYNAFAKLCCHPLQRQRQIETQTFDFLTD